MREELVLFCLMRRIIVVKAYKIYTGKINYKKDRSTLHIITLISIIVLLILNAYHKFPLIILFVPILTNALISVNYYIKEKLTKVVLKPASKELVYSKYHLFGLVQVDRKFKFKGDKMEEILNYYRKEKIFTIDCINDLIGNKVIFYN